MGPRRETPSRAAVDVVLAEAQRRGFLGPAPVAEHRRHAEAFLAALRPTARVLDLGTGGGQPGLVIAAACPETEVVLLDARQRRTDFLERAVARLGWTDRVAVVHGQAEVLGREPAWRGSVGAVVARGFGPPATTAECAAPFLRVGGQLLVSEPPPEPGPAPDRWPAAPLAELGLAVDDIQDHAAVRSFTLVAPCANRFPRAASRRVPLF